jgi:anti-anti-sigma factor
MVQVTQEQGVTVVVAGPSYTALQYRELEEFGEALLCEASQTTPPRLVVDLSQTDFIGSSFIELLVRAWKRLKNRNGTMALCAVHPYCREILRVSRLDTIWPIYGTRTEAVSGV